MLDGEKKWDRTVSRPKTSYQGSCFMNIWSHPMVKSSSVISSQVLGSIFAPSQKSKKLSHHFRVCFELDFGIINAPRKIFWRVSGPIWELQRFEAVKFQGIKCFTKMASNFSEINFGSTYHEKMNNKIAIWHFGTCPGHWIQIFWWFMSLVGR